MRRIFHKARQSAPSIVFFDEADTIAPKRLVVQNINFQIDYNLSIIGKKVKSKKCDSYKS